MKSQPLPDLMIFPLLFVFILGMMLFAYGTVETSAKELPAAAQTAIFIATPQATSTPQPTKTPTPRPTATATIEPSATPTIALTATNTPTFREMMKSNIVFYLIQPQKGHQDACGDIQLVPIVSKRVRSGDKLYDVQVALQMLFSLKRKIYIQWYNALWDTNFTIDSYEYNAQKDYMTIHFGGYLDAGQLSNCDKQGIREQIWATFFHYGIREKTFKINGVFLIDQLSRETK